MGTAPEPTSEPTYLGHRIRLLREKKGLSRDELAQRAGLAAEYLAHLEDDHVAFPSYETVAGVASALGTSVPDLTSDGQASLPADQ
jgi:transcriptional regulator with XRE-family HTH domain